jgi:circadian clock protein KaiB
MTAAPDTAALATGGASYALTLFVSGASGLAAKAIDDIRLLCDEHVTAHVHLTVVDIHAEPAAAVRHGVHVAPTLVRTRPLPVRRIVGDLSQTQRVLATLLSVDAENDAKDRP